MSVMQRTFICLLLISILVGGTTSIRLFAQELIIKPCQDECINYYDYEGHWSETLMKWASYRKILNGYTDGSFQPDRIITEAEFLKALYRAFGIALPMDDYGGTTKDWDRGVYSLAESWNHPVLGLTKPELKRAPITQSRAAEIITAAQGYHYEGMDNIVYLFGNRMGNGQSAQIEEFHPEQSLTRAETIKWIRQLTLAGMTLIKAMPEELSDRNLLPKVSVLPDTMYPEFSIKPASKEDFNLIGMGSAVGLNLGDNKTFINLTFGTPTHFNYTNSDIYPLFRTHYNDKGLLDYWFMEFDEEHADVYLSYKTNKGIELNKSTIFDVLEQYGSAGFINSGYLEYYYEQTDDDSYLSLDPLFSYSQMKNPEKSYIISFFYDDATLKIRAFSVSFAPYAFRPFSSS